MFKLEDPDDEHSGKRRKVETNAAEALLPPVLKSPHKTKAKAKAKEIKCALDPRLHPPTPPRFLHTNIPGLE